MTADADDQPQNNAAAAARAAPIVLLIVTACALVAIGSAGTGLLLPPADLNDRWLWAIRLAGAMAVAAGAAALLAQRRQLLSAVDRRYDPAIAALVTAASIMGVLALLSLLAPGSIRQTEAEPRSVTAERAPQAQDDVGDASGSARPPSGISGGFGVGVAGGRSDGGRTARPGDGSPDSDPRLERTRLGRLAAIFILIVLAGLAMISLRMLRSGAASPRLPLAEPPVAASDAEAGLQASLEALRLDDQDPRGGITAAYRTLLSALADAGAPRAPQEAPYEHLHRTLAPLSVDPAPMHRLAELYVVAQFSEHPVTADHRDAAAAALALALQSIRASHPTDARDRETAES